MTSASIHPADELAVPSVRTRSGLKWKVIAAFVAVFVLGAATGAAVGHVVEVRRALDVFDAARRGSRHGTFLWSLDRKLGLSADQRSAIEAILKSYDGRMDDAMAPVEESVREVRRAMRVEVREKLRREQQADFDQLMAEWDAARGRR
ncbi:MAG: hypothetical protein U0414_04450 [Polyangiaceae bacterium]